jgi:hypothetical protein
MNILTAGVTQGLVGAAVYMKFAGVSMGVYQQAKNSGDEDVMKKALGYASNSMSNAAKSSKNAGEALKEAQSEASAQAKADQQAALEKQHQKTAREAESQQQTASKLAPVDTVEISEAGKVHVEAAQGTMPTTDTVDVPTQPANAVVTDTRIYTPQGEVKPASAEPELSVTA